MAQGSDISTFAHMIAEGCETYRDKTALTFVGESASTVEIRSYYELYCNGNALAAFLLEQGMNIGDRFAVLLGNTPEFIEVLIAASISGCAMVSADPGIRGEKLASVLRNANCRGVICTDDNCTEVASIAADSPLEWSLLLILEDSGIVGDGLPGVESYFSVVSQSRKPVVRPS